MNQLSTQGIKKIGLEVREVRQRIQLVNAFITEYNHNNHTINQYSPESDKKYILHYQLETVKDCNMQAIQSLTEVGALLLSCDDLKGLQEEQQNPYTTDF